MEPSLKARHSLAVLALVPVLLFSFLPLAAMTPAFDQPAQTASWVS